MAPTGESHQGGQKKSGGSRRRRGGRGKKPDAKSEE
jgi:hypothetical protein